jgi:hypothetical protein
MAATIMRQRLRAGLALSAVRAENYDLLLLPGGGQIKRFDKGIDDNALMSAHIRVGLRLADAAAKFATLQIRGVSLKHDPPR